MSRSKHSDLGRVRRAKRLAESTPVFVTSRHFCTSRNFSVSLWLVFGYLSPASTPSETSSRIYVNPPLPLACVWILISGIDTTCGFF